MDKEARKPSSKTAPSKDKRPKDKDKAKEKDKAKDESKVHKLSLKGSSRLVAEFVCPTLWLHLLQLAQMTSF